MSNFIKRFKLKCYSSPSPPLSYHHHHHNHQNHNLENNFSLAQNDEINHDTSDDDEKDCGDESDNNDDIDTYDEEEDDEDEDQEVYVIKNDVDETDSLTLEVSSAASSHSRCFICKNYVGRNSSPFKVISNDGIIDVYVKTKIFVTFGSRCCADHLTDGGFLKEECLSQKDVFKEEKTFNKFIIFIFKQIFKKKFRD
jgi:hypothetical protein